MTGSTSEFEASEVTVAGISHSTFSIDIDEFSRNDGLIRDNEVASQVCLIGTASAQK
jgi:hypothetical protein